MPVSWKSILDMSFIALNTTHWPNHSHFTLWCYLIFTFQQSNRKIFTQGFSIHHTAVIELNKRPASVPFLVYSFGRCHCPWMQGWRDDQAANESDFSFFILCLQCTVWMNFFHPWPSSSGNNESWEVTDRSEYVTRIIGVIYQSAVYKYSTLWCVALKTGCMKKFLPKRSGAKHFKRLVRPVNVFSTHKNQSSLHKKFFVFVFVCFNLTKCSPNRPAGPLEDNMWIYYTLCCDTVLRISEGFFIN